MSCGSQAASTCANGYIFNSNSNNCEPSAPSCGAFAYFNGASCICLSGYSLVNNICQQCPAGTAFDGSQCSSSVIVQPTLTCGSNQVEINGVCVCNSGLYNVGGLCLPCPAYTKWNGQFCQCGCDTTGWCFGQPFSAFNSTTKTCSCLSGYTNVNGLCTASS